MRLIVSLLLLLVAVTAGADEGMFPVSELGRLDLAGAGLEIPATAIFDPDGNALVDGICKLGGCTGSFVSAQGLILTNHHCAFRAIRDASDRDHDYLTDGFAAAGMADEVPAVGYTVRITDSYRDVSDEVLDALTPQMAPADRTRAVEKAAKSISLRYEQEHPGKRAEVAEMFPGKTWVLYVYTYLRDVRLVYSPPLAVANFGGEADNWIWPRHSGDFSFMRAYTGPDGEPADYSEQNVPYHPAVVLEVAAQGVADGDPVFVVGYPGRTYRHRSSYHLAFLNDTYMPAVVDWYGWQIDLLEGLGADDRDRQLRLASRIKSLHNTHKNYRGKLQGISRLSLVEQRRGEEDLLREFTAADDRFTGQSDVLDSIGRIYTEQAAATPWEYWLRSLRSSPRIVRVAMTLWENAIESGKPDVERESPYMERNRRQTLDGLVVTVENFDPEADELILAELLERSAGIERARQLPALEGLDHGGLAAAFAGTHLLDKDYVVAAFDLSSEDLAAAGDPFLDLAAALYGPWLDLRETRKSRKGELDVLQADLLDLRRTFLGSEFVPDANGTLRLSFGRVEGYAPRDAVWYTPVTTVAGLLEKDSGVDPYHLPSRTRELAGAGDWGRFAPDSESGVPVNILYSTDTTGGNSGSPVLDARGRVVGLNFDRSWEATINDFAWNHDYSRSIGVDIRYVLWVTWKFGAGERLLAEMGVDPVAGD
ncbi:S46 family peptidase [bacterium]|nr:MAG: S46 family peptidase [bacterium]